MFYIVKGVEWPRTALINVKTVHFFMFLCFVECLHISIIASFAVIAIGEALSIVASSLLSKDSSTIKCSSLKINAHVSLIKAICNVLHIFQTGGLKVLEKIFFRIILSIIIFDLA